MDLMDVEVGEKLWVPVSPIRGNRFRAAKVEVLDRVSVNHYEENHAIDEWPKDDRHPTPHEVSEGINEQTSDKSSTGTDRQGGDS
jgi:hypothetical protein